MEINIIFSKKRIRNAWKYKAYAIYIYASHSQELFTKRAKSTVSALKHEDMHQVLHELCNIKTSIEYDNVYKKVEVEI